MKSILSRVASLVMLLLLFATTIYAEGDLVTNMVNNFDEKNIVLRFAAISDTHLNAGTAKMEESLRQLYKKVGENKLDAIFVAGDLTDNGARSQVETLKKVLDKFKIAEKGTEFIFALGNHDLDFDEKPYNGEMFKEVLGDYAYKGATAEEIKNGNHHTIVNGYHFIAVNCKFYNGGCHHAPEDLDWLKVQLQKAVADDPKKPIFVATHPVVYDTVYGSKESTYWYSTNINDVLKDFPQVFTFGGHLHFPLNDERNIMQKNYTALGTGCTLYCSLESEIEKIKSIDTNGGMEPSDCHSFSQGLYLEVDKNNNVRITRMDFFNKVDLKQPWVVEAPKSDLSHLKAYTYEARSAINKAPYFEPGAAVKIKKLTRTKLDIEFDAAKDDDYVYYYEIHLLEKDSGYPAGYVHTITYSDFYRQPEAANMKKQYKKSIDVGVFRVIFLLETDREYVVQIVAVDSFGQKSEPIVSEGIYVQI